MHLEMILSPSNDNIQYHIRNEIEALILIFKYRIAPILKLTYKFSIHLIFASLLLSKCTYKEWITETVCSEIKFIFQRCQFKCSQGLFSGHPTNVPQRHRPSRHSSSQGAAGDLGRRAPGEQTLEHVAPTLHTPSYGAASFYQWRMFLVLRSLPFTCNSLARRSRITDPFPCYLLSLQVALLLISTTATYLADKCPASQCVTTNCNTAQWDSTSHLLGWLLWGRQEITTAGGDLAKRTPLCAIGGIVHACSHCGEQCGGSSKQWKQNHNRTQQCPLWVHSQRKWNHYLEEIPSPPCSLQHYSQYPRYGNNPSIHQWMNQYRNALY